MGWLKRVRAGLAAAEKASELAQDVQTCQRAWEEVAGNVADLREALVDQQRRNDQIVVEWATTLDKISRWASRQSARERKDTNKKLDELSKEPADNGAPVDSRSMTKPQLRALAARMRLGGAGVASDAGQ